MTTLTPTPTAPSEFHRALALAGWELRLVLRNKTVAVSSILIPIGLGLLWAFTFDHSPRLTPMVLALQVAVVLGMGVYVTATQTAVARRHDRVLTRMRTSGMSDGALLTATVAPAVVIGVVQLAVFTVINGVTGIPLPADPVVLVLGVLGGLALAVPAALATTIVTRSPERAQITTLPLTFLLLGAAIAAAVLPAEGWLRALVAVPGAAVGDLVRLGVTGEAWAAGVLGLPQAVPALVASVVWPVVFVVLTRRGFRWDERS